MSNEVKKLESEQELVRVTIPIKQNEIAFIGGEIEKTSNKAEKKKWGFNLEKRNFVLKDLQNTLQRIKNTLEEISRQPNHYFLRKKDYFLSYLLLPRSSKIDPTRVADFEAFLVEFEEKRADPNFEDAKKSCLSLSIFIKANATVVEKGNLYRTGHSKVIPKQIENKSNVVTKEMEEISYYPNLFQKRNSAPAPVHHSQKNNKENSNDDSSSDWEFRIDEASKIKEEVGEIRSRSASLGSIKQGP